MAGTYAVIMAGGAGTRFWPASRRLRPKQLLALAGEGEPLLAATVRRIAGLVPAERVVVVTGEHLAAPTRAALPGVPEGRVLKEPAPRNTAPCIAWAARVVAAEDPDAVVMVLPSDHHVTDEPAFAAVLERATRVAAEGRVTTVGIVPSRPETGFGYIEVGGALAGGAHEVARFVEKPDRARAEAFVAGGKHLWNAGMFFFRARDMNALVEAHLPELARGLDRVMAAAGTADAERVLAEVFPTLPNVSVDHGVMEKAAGLAVVPGDFGWSDVGSWQSAWELAPKDAHGNAVPDGAVVVDARGNLVRLLGDAAATGKKVALVGVSDLVVVDTGDALLVMPRDRAQDVRHAVDALKARGDGSLT